MSPGYLKTHAIATADADTFLDEAILSNTEFSFKYRGEPTKTPLKKPYCNTDQACTTI